MSNWGSIKGWKCHKPFVLWKSYHVKWHRHMLITTPRVSKGPLKVATLDKAVVANCAMCASTAGFWTFFVKCKCNLKCDIVRFMTSEMCEGDDKIESLSALIHQVPYHWTNVHEAGQKLKTSWRTWPLIRVCCHRSVPLGQSGKWTLPRKGSWEVVTWPLPCA